MVRESLGYAPFGIIESRSHMEAALVDHGIPVPHVAVNNGHNVGEEAEERKILSPPFPA